MVGDGDGALVGDADVGGALGIAVGGNEGAPEGAADSQATLLCISSV